MSETISRLLNKYETKQPGEAWSPIMNKEYGYGLWTKRQKLREADIMMDQLHMKGSQREQVMHMISDDFDDLRKLIRRCPSEKILAIICFFVMKSYNVRVKLNEYRAFNELNISKDEVILVFNRIALFYQSKVILPRVMTTNYKEEDVFYKHNK